MGDQKEKGVDNGDIQERLPVEDDSASLWPTLAQTRQAKAQARNLAAQAATSGLRFEAFLPPELASWVLGQIEQGTFFDPSEAAFVMMGEFEELQQHPDLRHQLLQRRLQRSMDDLRPNLSVEEVDARIQALRDTASLEPAVWRRPTDL